MYEDGYKYGNEMSVRDNEVLVTVDKVTILPATPVSPLSTSKNPLNLTLNGSAATNTSEYSMELMSTDTQRGLIFLYTVTTLLSVTGNVFVVVVFARGRRSRTDLRPFLINLAISDLVASVFCLPFSFTYVLLRTWVFSKPMCPVVLFFQLLSVTASVFTNMAIGVDRFMAVTFPLRSRITSARSKFVLATIWILAVSLSSIQLFVGRAEDISVTATIKITQCEEKWSAEDRRIYTLFILFVTYILPLSILTVTYSIVGCVLWRRTAPGNADQARDMQQLKSKRKVVKMLVIVVLTFALCWLPLHAFFLVTDFNPDLLRFETPEQERFFTSLYYCAHWLAMSNCLANPIIYGFMNESFRADLICLFYRWFPCCKCLKKMMPSKTSVSTYYTVDDRRNSNFNCYRPSKQLLAVRSENGHRLLFEVDALNNKDSSDV